MNGEADPTHNGEHAFFQAIIIWGRGHRLEWSIMPGMLPAFRLV